MALVVDPLPLHPLRMNPPNVDSPSCHSLLRRLLSMTEQRGFVVRPLPGSSLEGAFRVHLAPDALEKLGLKVGDLCHITSDGNPSGGYGIAWRATDKMGNAPRVRPAKMSDTLRTAFNLNEGSHVSIDKTKARIIHADKLTLTDVTPAATNNTSTTEADDNCWLARCIGLLCSAEAVTIGMTFDVDSRKKSIKKRFYIDRIEAKDAKPGEPALFTCDDNTKIIFNDGAATPNHIHSNGDSPIRLDTSRIGGLLAQVKELNKRLDRVLNRSPGAPMDMIYNRHIILHGYEGTGKSLLLRRLEAATHARTFRLDKATLPTGTPTKNLSTIQQTFKDALASQPSLILMDNLDRLVPPDDEVYSPLLDNALDSLCGSRVLVVGSARSLARVDPPLLRAGRFSANIELPIPDVDARRQILNVLAGKRPESNDPVSAAISLKTHGFTPSDLALLAESAGDFALDRHEENRGEWISIQARASLIEASSPSQVASSIHSQATTLGPNTLSRPQTQDSPFDSPLDPHRTIQDYESALLTIRPTALREIFLEPPKVPWSDIGGADAIKTRFDEIIGWPLYYADILSAHRLQTQKGVLLYGPPGCSKTLTAQAVATTYDLNFIAVKGAELISMYVGESERAVREIFRKARQASPCVIFFDEIDSIGADRDQHGTKGLNVLTTLLNEMDGFEEMKGVLVLAATNKPEILDPALLRPGRFDSHVYLGPPDSSARRAIVEIGIKGIRAAEDVDFGGLVEEMEGYSGAEIRRICELAKMGAVRRMIEGQQGAGAGGAGQEAVIRKSDFEEGLRGTKRGITADMVRGYEEWAERGA